MKRQTLCLVWVALVLIPLRVSVSAQQSLLLTDDIRLKTKASADYVCIDLKGFCQLLSEKSLVIKAHNECQETKLQCRFNGRTRANIMQMLAEWLPGSWEKLPNDTGYQLVRTGRATKQKKEWWETFLRVRQRAYQAQAERLLEEMRVTPQQRPIEVIRSKENSDDGMPPLPDPNKERAFFNVLPDNIRQKIVQTHINYADYQKESVFGMMSLSPGLSLTVALPESARRTLADEGLKLPGDAQIRLRYMGESVHAMIFSSGSPQPLYFASVSIHALTWFREALRLKADWIGLTEGIGKDAPNDWKLLAAWQKQTVWKNTLLPQKEQPQIVSPIAGRTRAAALTELINTPNVEYLADYSSTIGQDENSVKERENAPDNAEWNQFAADYDSSWKKASGVVLVRNNRWYRDEELEVPHDLAKQWLRKRTQRKVQTQRDPREMVEQACEYARPLTLWQASNGLAWLSQREIASTPKEWQKLLAKEIRTGPPLFFFDAQMMLQLYDTVLFCNSLSEDARRALFEKRLSTEMLTRTQKEAIARIVPEIQSGSLNGQQMILGVDMVGEIIRMPGIKVFLH